jgi:RepB DNA-primase from phage plasmid/Primase C terminal 2 (PriCT-2)
MSTNENPGGVKSAEGLRSRSTWKEEHSDHTQAPGHTQVPFAYHNVFEKHADTLALIIWFDDRAEMRGQTPIDWEPALLVADRAEAERFLALLDPEAKRFTFQTIDDSKKGRGSLARILHGTLDQHRDKLESLNNQGAGIFVTINATNGKGRTAKDVTRVRALFLDLDGAPLKPVHQAKPAPHIIVESSRGHYHAYWLVKDIPLEVFTGMQRALAERFDGDPNVCDLPRVMRLPGFMHCKRKPFWTSFFIQWSECEPYTAAELAELIPAAATDSKANGKNPFPSNLPPPDMEEIVAAVCAIHNNDDTSRERWYKVGFAIIEATNKSDEGFELFDEWSQRWHKYNAEDTERFWRTAKIPTDLNGVAKLIYMANKDSPGWQVAVTQ